MKKTILFNTLWALVIHKLNKANNAAHCLRLGKIINSYRIRPIYPYKELPNVRAFAITKLQPYDPILKDYGIRKRLGPAEREWTRYRNKSMNRYVRRQFNYLNLSTGNPKRF